MAADRRPYGLESVGSGPVTAGRTPVPLDVGPADRADLSAEVLAAIEGFFEALDGGPASFGPTEQALIDSLLDPPPEERTRDIGALLDTVLGAARTGFETAAGTQLSYVPNGGLYTAALGRFLAAALNRWTGAGFAQPGAVAIEQSVIKWMLDLFGLGPQAAGLLVSGGSMATLEAVVTARTRFGPDFADAVIYTSDRAHHSVAKAARMAGLAADGIRSVETDARQRIDPVALERAIRADQAQGRRPMMMVATAGTTDTGSIDPLHACADVAAEHGLWFHVDAAYGGFFILTDRGRHLLDGIERADSITVDPHKSLLVPFGVGGLLVAERAHLLAAHDGRGPYLRDLDEADDGLDGRSVLPDYCALGAELTRPFRGLDVWLALQVHGVAAFRRELDRMLDLAQRTASRLGAVRSIELVTEPELSIVAFRCRGGDEATAAVAAHLNRSREVHVSSTTVEGRLAVRLAYLNHRTTEAVADRAVDLVADAVGACQPGSPNPAAA